MGGFKLENVLVSLHSLKNNGPWPLGDLGSIIFKEWRDTRTFSYTYEVGWESDCCLTQNERFVSYVMVRTSYIQ